MGRATRIDTMKMVREIRDKLGELRRNNPKEYYARLDARYEKMKKRKEEYERLKAKPEAP